MPELMMIGTEPPLKIAREPARPVRAHARVPSVFEALAQRGLLAITGQVVSSGTRFCTSVVIGRLCGPTELGFYSLAFTLYCLAICMQEALIALPFTIYDSRQREDQRRQYAGSVLIHYMIYASALALIVATACGVLLLTSRSSGFATVLCAFGVALPLMLLVDFARRFAIARLDLTTALKVDLSLSMMQLGGLALLVTFGWLSAATAYLAIAVGAAAAGLTWLLRTRDNFNLSWVRARTDAVHNWRYSRWVLASQVAHYSRTDLLPWVLVSLLGATATGIYAACDMTILFANPVLLAISNVLVSSAAQAYSVGTVKVVRQMVLYAIAVLAAFTSLLATVLVFKGGAILALVFGNSYEGNSTVISILAFAVIAEGVGLPAGNGLLAIEKPRINFIACLIGAATALLTTFALAPYLGIVGAAIGSLVGRCLGATVQVVSFLRITSARLKAEVSV